MSKYRKQSSSIEWVLGLLYIVEVRFVRKGSNEKTKQRLLMVGSEEKDIDRKLRWKFDLAQFSEFSITRMEKVREKIHLLNTVIEPMSTTPLNPVIERQEGTQIISQVSGSHEKYDPHLYAIGLATTMLGKDESHAMRKLGSALVTSGSEIKSRAACELPDGSTLTIERIPMRSGTARPRDVSIELNRASFVRG